MINHHFGRIFFVTFSIRIFTSNLRNGFVVGYLPFQSGAELMIFWYVDPVEVAPPLKKGLAGK